MDNSETKVLRLEADSKVIEPQTDFGFRRTFKSIKNEAKAKKVIKGKGADPYPDVLPVNEESLKRHDTGADKLNPHNARTKIHRQRLEKKKSTFLDRIEKTARAEILNKQDEG
jgi:hypothetical protein